MVRTVPVRDIQSEGILSDPGVHPFVQLGGSSSAPSTDLPTLEEAAALLHIEDRFLVSGFHVVKLGVFHYSEKKHH